MGVFLLSLGDSQAAPLRECAVPSGQRTGSTLQQTSGTGCGFCACQLRPPVSARAAHRPSIEPALSPAGSDACSVMGSL